MTDSLAKARHRKALKARELEALGSGTLTVGKALRELPIALEAASLWEVLMAAPHIGPERARTICERAKVFPLAKLGSLTKTEVSEITDRLPESQRK